MTSPLDFQRRTPLRRTLEAAGASWGALKDAAIAERIASPSAAAGLRIADLSPLPRLGFKGRGTIDAMKKRGLTVEAAPNRAFRQPDGGLCLVLAPGEVILLSNLKGDGARFEDLHASWRIEDEERTYPLLRRDSHAWMAIDGDKAPEMFAKICGVDLRTEQFPDLSIAQTSVAKLSAIVTRADIGKRTVYHLLADSASARYFLTCLLDAAEEFGGRLAGLSDFQDIDSS